MMYKCYFCGTKDEDEWVFSTLFGYRICRSCVDKVVNYLKEKIEIDAS